MGGTGRARDGLIGCPRAGDTAGRETWDEGRCSVVQLQIVMIPGAASDETQTRDNLSECEGRADCWVGFGEGGREGPGGRQTQVNRLVVATTDGVV